MFGWLRRDAAASGSGASARGVPGASAQALAPLVPDPRQQADTEVLFAQATTADAAARQAARAALGNGAGVRARVASDLLLADPHRRTLAAEWLGDLGDPAAIAPLATALRVERLDGVRSAMLDALEALGAPVADHVDLPRLLHDARVSGERPLAPALVDFPWQEIPALHLADAEGVLEPELVRHLVVLAVRARRPTPDAQLRHVAGLVWREDAEAFAALVRRHWESIGRDPRRCGFEAVAMAFAGHAQPTTPSAGAAMAPSGPDARIATAERPTGGDSPAHQSSAPQPPAQRSMTR